MESQQFLIDYWARCETCYKTCASRNAQLWSHQHVRTTGHVVIVSLGYRVRPSEE